jgi:hypothetical protein
MKNWKDSPLVEWSAFQRKLPANSNVSKTITVALSGEEKSLIKRVLKEQAITIPSFTLTSKLTPEKKRRVLYALWEAGYDDTALFKRIALA